MPRLNREINSSPKDDLGEILAEANLLIERQIHIIRQDIDSFSVFIAEMKKESILTQSDTAEENL
jgi:hypothetical protein